MSKEERKIVVDRAFPVVKVGVADARSLNAYYDLSRSGVRHDYGLKSDRFAFASGNYALGLARHLFSSNIFESVIFPPTRLGQRDNYRGNRCD
tara:strand:+ start:564 stop:842 length:279 start_codon:yes stop_codon:yes gene_type:complete